MEEKEVKETTETVEEATEENTQPNDEWKDKYVRLYADFDNYKHLVLITMD